MEFTQVMNFSFEESDVVDEPKVEATLEVDGIKYNIMTGVNKIGRDPNLCSVVLNFQIISAEHAKIDASSDGHFISDLGSRNKTRWKKKPLKPHVQYNLEDGDTIMFADKKATYHITGNQDKGTNSDRDEEKNFEVPETPAAKRAPETSLVVPESPNTSGFCPDESFILSSQPVAANNKPVVPVGRFSVIDESIDEEEKQEMKDDSLSTPGCSRKAGLESSLARIENANESQASFKLLLSESISVTDNDSLSKSLQVDCDQQELVSNAANLEGSSARQNASGRDQLNGNIHEDGNELITLPQGDANRRVENGVVEQEDQNDERSTVDEAELQMVTVAQSSDRSTENVKGTVSKEEDETAGDEKTELDDDIYEAETQLFAFPQSSVRQAQILKNTLKKYGVASGGEEKTGLNDTIYEADTQVVLSGDRPESPNSETAQNDSEGLEPDTSVYEAETQAFAFAEPRRIQGKKSSQASKADSGGNVPDSKISDAQVLPLSSRDVHSPEEDNSIYEAQTQLVFSGDRPEPQNSDTAQNESEGLEPDTSVYEAETQVFAFAEPRRVQGKKSSQVLKADSEGNVQVSKIPDAQILPSCSRDVCSPEEDNSIYEADTQLVFSGGRPESRNSETAQDDSEGLAPDTSVYEAETQAFAFAEPRSVQRKKSSQVLKADSEGNVPISKIPDAQILPPSSREGDLPKEDKTIYEAEMQLTFSGGRPESRNETVQNDSNRLEPNGDVYDAEAQAFAEPRRVRGRKSSLTHSGGDVRDKVLEEQILPSSSTRTPSPSDGASSKEDKNPVQSSLNDGEIDINNILDTVVVISPKSPLPNETVSGVSVGREQDDEMNGRASSDQNIFLAPEDEKDSIFDCATQLVFPHERRENDVKDGSKRQMPTKSKSGRSDEKPDSENEDIFSCATQVLLPKNKAGGSSAASERTDVRKSRKEDASSGDETDEENSFAVPERTDVGEPIKSGRSDEKPDSENEDIFSCATQVLLPKKKAGESSAASERTDVRKSRKEDASSGDETDEENSFAVPERTDVGESIKSGRSDEKPDSENEDIFSCATQVLLTKKKAGESSAASERTDVRKSRKEDASSGDDTDEENSFAVPERTDVGKPSKSGLSDEKPDSENDDIFSCATQVLLPKQEEGKCSAASKRPDVRKSRKEDASTGDETDEENSFGVPKRTEVGEPSKSKRSDEKPDSENEDIFSCATQVLLPKQKEGKSSAAPKRTDVRKSRKVDASSGDETDEGNSFVSPERKRAEKPRKEVASSGDDESDEDNTFDRPKEKLQTRRKKNRKSSPPAKTPDKQVTQQKKSGKEHRDRKGDCDGSDSDDIFDSPTQLIHQTSLKDVPSTARDKTSASDEQGKSNINTSVNDSDDTDVEDILNCATQKLMPQFNDSDSDTMSADGLLKQSPRKPQQVKSTEDLSTADQKDEDIFNCSTQVIPRDTKEKGGSSSRPKREDAKQSAKKRTSVLLQSSDSDKTDDELLFDRPKPAHSTLSSVNDQSAKKRSSSALLQSSDSDKTDDELLFDRPKPAPCTLSSVKDQSAKKQSSSALLQSSDSDKTDDELLFDRPKLAPSTLASAKDQSAASSSKIVPSVSRVQIGDIVSDESSNGSETLLKNADLQHFAFDSESSARDTPELLKDEEENSKQDSKSDSATHIQASPATAGASKEPAVHRGSPRLSSSLDSEDGNERSENDVADGSKSKQTKKRALTVHQNEENKGASGSSSRVKDAEKEVRGGVQEETTLNESTDNIFEAQTQIIPKDSVKSLKTEISQKSQENVEECQEDAGKDVHGGLHEETSLNEPTDSIFDAQTQILPNNAVKSHKADISQKPQENGDVGQKEEESVRNCIQENKSSDNIFDAETQVITMDPVESHEAETSRDTIDPRSATTISKQAEDVQLTKKQKRKSLMDAVVSGKAASTSDVTNETNDPKHLQKAPEEAVADKAESVKNVQRKVSFDPILDVGQSISEDSVGRASRSKRSRLSIGSTLCKDPLASVTSILTIDEDTNNKESVLSKCRSKMDASEHKETDEAKTHASVESASKASDIKRLSPRKRSVGPSKDADTRDCTPGTSEGETRKVTSKDKPVAIAAVKRPLLESEEDLLGENSGEGNVTPRSKCRKIRSDVSQTSSQSEKDSSQSNGREESLTPRSKRRIARNESPQPSVQTEGSSQNNGEEESLTPRSKRRKVKTDSSQPSLLTEDSSQNNGGEENITPRSKRRKARTESPQQAEGSSQSKGGEESLTPRSKRQKTRNDIPQTSLQTIKEDSSQSHVEKEEPSRRSKRPTIKEDSSQSSAENEEPSGRSKRQDARNDISEPSLQAIKEDSSQSSAGKEEPSRRSKRQDARNDVSETSLHTIKEDSSQSSAGKEEPSRRSKRQGAKNDISEPPLQAIQEDSSQSNVEKEEPSRRSKRQTIKEDSSQSNAEKEEPSGRSKRQDARNDISEPSLQTIKEDSSQSSGGKEEPSRRSKRQNARNDISQPSLQTIKEDSSQSSAGKEEPSRRSKRQDARNDISEPSLQTIKEDSSQSSAGKEEPSRRPKRQDARNDISEPSLQSIKEDSSQSRAGKEEPSRKSKRQDARSDISEPPLQAMQEDSSQSNVEKEESSRRSRRRNAENDSSQPSDQVEDNNLRSNSGEGSFTYRSKRGRTRNDSSHDAEKEGESSPNSKQTKTQTMLEDKIDAEISRSLERTVEGFAEARRKSRSARNLAQVETATGKDVSSFKTAGSVVDDPKKETNVLTTENKVSIRLLSVCLSDVGTSKGKTRGAPKRRSSAQSDVSHENAPSATDASSNATASRRSGRAKVPSWKVRGEDQGLKKTLVLSYSQDEGVTTAEDDTQSPSKEETASSVVSQRRGRTKKAEPTTSGKKSVNVEEDHVDGRVSRSSIDTEEEKTDVPITGGRGRGRGRGRGGSRGRPPKMVTEKQIETVVEKSLPARTKRATTGDSFKLPPSTASTIAKAGSSEVNLSTSSDLHADDENESAVIPNKRGKGGRRKKEGAPLNASTSAETTVVASPVKPEEMRQNEGRGRRGAKKSSSIASSRESIANTSFDHGDTSLDANQSFSSTATLSPRSSRRRVQKMSHRVLFTGYSDTELERAVGQLGGSIVENVDAATVVITDKVRRTIKLLSMVGRGLPVVTPTWLKVSKASGAFVDPWRFILKDTEAESKFNFTMEASLETARTKKLFDGFTIFVTSNVNPPPESMKDIIVSCGGDVVRKPLQKWPEKSLIVSCAEDVASVKRIRNRPVVVVAECVLTGVLRQRLETELFTLKL